MNSKEIEQVKKNLKITNIQKQVIVGLLLGDGHLEKIRNGRLFRLKVEYGRDQKEYAEWLWNLLKDWTRSAPMLRRKQTPSGKEIEAVGFTTYSHGSFRFYGQQFYSKGGRKKIPKMINKLISPLSLAIWFMDDGSLKSNQHRTYIIHADGYDLKDLKIIQSALKNKFSIETSLHRQYRKWRIYVKTSSAEKFRKLIEKYVIPEMRYKLGNINSLKSNGGVY